MAWYKDWFGEEYAELYSYRDDSEAEQDADFVEHYLGGGPRTRGPCSTSPAAPAGTRRRCASGGTGRSASTSP